MHKENNNNNNNWDECLTAGQQREAAIIFPQNPVLNSITETLNPISSFKILVDIRLSYMWSSCSVKRLNHITERRL